MDRKGFLKRFFLGAAGVLATGSQLPAKPGKEQRIRLAVVLIAGFSYYDGPEAEPLLEVGMQLDLNREPHNPHDRNAVEVWAGDAKLGYVPRSSNKPVARLMDEGVKVQAEILELAPDHSSDRNVKIELYYLQDTKTVI
jgi:hypothetical protein